MHAKTLSVTLAAVLALAVSQSRILAADPAPHAAVEAADRQFLTALENGEPEPVASGIPDPQPQSVTPAKPAKHGASKGIAAPAVKKEPVPAKVANVAPKKAVPTVKREARRAPEEIEVRRAIPVTVTTTTRTSHTSIANDDDDDRDHDEDHDDDSDHHDGFFDRLFRGEKIFR